jgi:hypothetical protein
MVGVFLAILLLASGCGPSLHQRRQACLASKDAQSAECGRVLGQRAANPSGGSQYDGCAAVCASARGFVWGRVAEAEREYLAQMTAGVKEGNGIYEIAIQMLRWNSEQKLRTLALSLWGLFFVFIRFSFLWHHDLLLSPAVLHSS